MPAAVSVIVADAQRMTAVGGSITLPGRVLRFTSGNLASALEGIRASKAGLLAVDGAFAATPEGQAFVDRVQKLQLPGLEIRLITRSGGAWGTSPLGAPSVPAATAPARTSAAGGTGTSGTSVAAAPPAIDVKASGLNTRRTPRFIVLDPLDATIDSGTAGLIDVSVMGAQLLSKVPLRPTQVVKIGLPDTAAAVRVTARVAWALFERPAHSPDAYYRAGVEFTDGVRPTLEQYCKRHCAEDPTPIRGGRKR
jgi:PilZ domain-containing protein